MKDYAAKHGETWLPPRCAPLEISKPVTPLRSLVSPLIRAPFPLRGRPAQPLRSAPGISNFPSELKTLGLPPPQTRAPKGVPFGNSIFKPPTLGAWAGLALPPCGTPPGQSVPDSALPGRPRPLGFSPASASLPLFPRRPRTLRSAPASETPNRRSDIRLCQAACESKGQAARQSRPLARRVFEKCFWLKTRNHSPTPGARPPSK